MSITTLVSVIIPCYNHGRYLQKAINSVLAQSYHDVEIIVVDDGSTDDTKRVAQQNKKVQYVYQNNRGLSAARNTGIHSCKGDFLVFLDADDYLYEDAIAVNLDYIQKNELLAFVSGSHDKVFSSLDSVQPVIKIVNAEHYTHLLRGNYIGMHATVMYRRWVFDEYIFDTSLKACEDYDLYLKIARKHPVLHHANKVAAYCFHGSNMSKNAPLMLETALKVLRRQKRHLLNSTEAKAYSEGIKLWKSYYVQELYTKMWEEDSFSWRDYYTLLKHNEYMAFHEFYNISKLFVIYKLLRRTNSERIKGKLSSYLPDKVLIAPSPGKVKFGDFNRLVPFSDKSGIDRGGSINSYYIGNFLGNESLYIKGRTLEVGSNHYTLQYGADRVDYSDVLHLDNNSDTPASIFVEDIGAIPNDTYDCIILIQKLNQIYNFKDALAGFYRILKPGGALLVTVSGITPLNHTDLEEVCWWAFTDKTVQKILGETFPKCSSEVFSYGNIFTATALLYGIGHPEISYEKLAYNDPAYQVIVTSKTIKSST